MKGLSPTQRTLAALRDRGMRVDKVERWNQFAGPHGIRQDMFGFGDLIALDPENHRIIAVQCCAGSGHAAHKRKITEDCADDALLWLKCNGGIELWSWSKKKLVRGGKAERWMPRCEVITEDMIAGVAPEEAESAIKRENLAAIAVDGTASDEWINAIRRELVCGEDWSNRTMGIVIDRLDAEITRADAAEKRCAELELAMRDVQAELPQMEADMPRDCYQSVKGAIDSALAGKEPTDETQA